MRQWDPRDRTEPLPLELRKAGRVRGDGEAGFSGRSGKVSGQSALEESVAEDCAEAGTGTLGSHTHGLAENHLADVSLCWILSDRTKMR